MAITCVVMKHQTILAGPKRHSIYVLSGVSTHWRGSVAKNRRVRFSKPCYWFAITLVCYQKIRILSPARCGETSRKPIPWSVSSIAPCDCLHRGRVSSKNIFCATAHVRYWYGATLSCLHKNKGVCLCRDLSSYRIVWPIQTSRLREDWRWRWVKPSNVPVVSGSVGAAKWSKMARRVREHCASIKPVA